MHSVSLNGQALTRHAGVTVWTGPHLLLANVGQPRPALVAPVRRDGTLVWPEKGFVKVRSLEATEDEIRQAARDQALLKLAPWEETQREAPAGFVFDLIAVPEDQFN